MKRKKLFVTLKSIVLLLILILFFTAVYFFLVLQPSNNRNWEVGMEILPHFTINGNTVTVQDERDYHYDNGQTTSMGYVNRSFDVNKLENVWFVLEPFGQYKGVAHTYFVFDFSDQDPVVVSVEARREKGEKYDAWIGMFNQYELMYIWGTEMDETVRRVVVENNKLFMYPLQISNNGKKQLFLQLAQASKDLETHPRFYNTITSNCTNELAKAANKVKPGAIPLNIAEFLPGFADEELYKLGYLPQSVSLAELQKKYFISDLVRKYYKDTNFSQELRAALQ